jgi:hypothetical protein
MLRKRLESISTMVPVRRDGTFSFTYSLKDT